jgi:predicted alpha/beta-fold hydrolase
MLIGFSLGGNITLKYLGEQGENINPIIKRAVAISVPIDLEDSAVQLTKKSNAMYMKRFAKMLVPKLAEKANRFPECGLTNSDVSNLKTFYDFDDIYTAPAHGFKNARDYWKKCSSKPFLPKIKIPTLLINALNAPFLGAPSYPFSEAENSEFFYLETPKYGGHVGFLNNYKMNGELWNENRAIAFLQQAG